MVQVTKKTLNIGGRLIDLSEPKVMGILNLTPDSFFNGNRFSSIHEVLDRAAEMVEDGAYFLDVGGYSTRPGADEISYQQEIDRVLPIIEPLNKFLPEVIISIDTFRSEVAKTVIKKGAHMINDVSGGHLDHEMIATVLALNVPYILMHMRGTPVTMNSLSTYDHLVSDVIKELLEVVLKLQSRGFSDIIIDPGFGFAKNMQQNYRLLNYLENFKSIGLPILVGVSRKGMIYKKLETNPENALNGTTALNMLALEGGASILRVHDIKAAVEVIKLWQATRVIY